MSYTNPTADQTANPYLHTAQAPAVPVAAVRTSPGLAFLLGLIPGVGAIYNGQYLKGLLHVGIFGLLASATDRSGGGPLAGIAVGFFFYMPFEAYHTAKKRQMGLAVDEWSSIIPRSALSGRFPIGPILLIVLGVLFLLDELGWLRFYELVRFWPVLLIGLGAYLLYTRVSSGGAAPPPAAYAPTPYPAGNYPPAGYPPAYPTPAVAPQSDVTQVEVQREQ